MGKARRPSHSTTRTHKIKEFPHSENEILKGEREKLEKILKISGEQMKTIVDGFIETLENGLAKDDQMVPMFPTFVFSFPSGEEKGKYLALDLGGTNLRVCIIELQGKGKFEMTSGKYKLPDEMKSCEGKELFDFIADCMDEFLDEHFPDGVEGEHLPLGFTFSYPCDQHRIDHGILLRWTKGFSNPNVEGKDCAALFQEALDRRDIKVKVAALINDTTGTLIASNYVNPRTRIGCIYGTGCNAAYMEDADCIPKIAHLKLSKGAQMAINCEYGAFDSDKKQYLPRTKYDLTIDETSPRPGQQLFEKMIAGLYLGEIFRLILMDLHDQGVLFTGQTAIYKLEKPYSFDTALLSLIEVDQTDDLLTVTGLFTHFFGLDTTDAERRFFQQIARLLGERAARLSVCGIAAIIKKKNYIAEGGCDVAADGSLFKKYPHFQDRLKKGLADILGEEDAKKVGFQYAEDGSGVGAALIAAHTIQRKKEGFHEDL